MSTVKFLPLVDSILPGPSVNDSAKRDYIGVWVQSENGPYSLVLECGVTEAEHLCFFHCLGGVLPFNEMGSVIDLQAFHIFIRRKECQSPLLRC